MSEAGGAAVADAWGKQSVTIQPGCREERPGFQKCNQHGVITSVCHTMVNVLLFSWN